MKCQCYPRVMLCKSINWFLYEGNTGTVWVKQKLQIKFGKKNQFPLDYHDLFVLPSKFPYSLYVTAILLTCVVSRFFQLFFREKLYFSYCISITYSRSLVLRSWQKHYLQTKRSLCLQIKYFFCHIDSSSKPFDYQSYQYFWNWFSAKAVIFLYHSKLYFLCNY